MASRELEFVESLGEGGFGTVYLANLHGRDRFVRRVAVKVMRINGEELGDRLARQRDEARLLGLLHHDHIVQVLDLTEVDGRPAVVMEYVEGADFSDILRAMPGGNGNGTGIGARAALEVVLATASALDAAWSAPSAHTGRPLRVVHRDIKPANILVTPNGGVKVLDFGVARADFARESYTGSNAFGTPRYMAPEVWLGSDPSPAVDIYALGVTLVELLGGTMDRPPLQPLSRYTAHIENTLAKLSYPALADLLARCLDYEPERRPTAADLVEEVGLLLGSATGEPLSRIARRVVPPLVDARRKKANQREMPSRASLDTGVTDDLVAAPVSTLDVPRPSARVSVEPSLHLPVAVGVVAFLALGLSAVGFATAAWWATHTDTAAAQVAPVTVPNPEPPPPEPLPPETPPVQPIVQGDPTQVVPGTEPNQPVPEPVKPEDKPEEKKVETAVNVTPGTGTTTTTGSTGKTGSTGTTGSTQKTSKTETPKPAVTPETTTTPAATVAPAVEVPVVPPPKTAVLIVKPRLTATILLDGTTASDSIRKSTGLVVEQGPHTVRVTDGSDTVTCTLTITSDVKFDWSGQFPPEPLPKGCKKGR